MHLLPFKTFPKQNVLYLLSTVTVGKIDDWLSNGHEHQVDDSNSKHHHHRRHPVLDRLLVSSPSGRGSSLKSGVFLCSANLSTPASPCARPSTLISASNGQFFANNSPKLLSPIKSQSPHHHQGLSMMSMMPPTGLHHHHGGMSPYGTYLKRNGLDNLTSENQPIFDRYGRVESTKKKSDSPFVSVLFTICHRTRANQKQMCRRRRFSKERNSFELDSLL